MESTDDKIKNILSNEPCQKSIYCKFKRLRESIRISKFGISDVPNPSDLTNDTKYMLGDAVIVPANISTPYVTCLIKNYFSIRRKNFTSSVYSLLEYNNEDQHYFKTMKNMINITNVKSPLNYNKYNHNDVCETIHLPIESTSTNESNIGQSTNTTSSELRPPPPPPPPPPSDPLPTEQRPVAGMDLLFDATTLKDVRKNLKPFKPLPPKSTNNKFNELLRLNGAQSTESQSSDDDWGYDVPDSVEPAGNKPADNKPADSELADNKLADNKLADSEPAYNKPYDNKLADDNLADNKGFIAAKLKLRRTDIDDDEDDDSDTEISIESDSTGLLKQIIVITNIPVSKLSDFIQSLKVHNIPTVFDDYNIALFLKLSINTELYSTIILYHVDTIGDYFRVLPFKPDPPVAPKSTPFEPEPPVTPKPEPLNTKPSVESTPEPLKLEPLIAPKPEPSNTKPPPVAPKPTPPPVASKSTPPPVAPRPHWLQRQVKIL